MSKMLANMLSFMTAKHVDQFDKGGKPYALHPLAVMNLLETQNDVELLCIALGHDLFEDTDATDEDLRNIGCSKRVIEGIRCLTKITGESYDSYKSKVLSNYDAIRVKIADLKHNTDITRLKGVTEKDIARTAKYYAFYVELLQAKTQFEF